MKKRLLILANTVTFVVQAGPGLVLPTTRWVYNTRPTGLAGHHLAVGAMGNFGLSGFSFSFLVLMHALIKPMCKCTMEPTNTTTTPTTTSTSNPPPTTTSTTTSTTTFTVYHNFHYHP